MRINRQMLSNRMFDQRTSCSRKGFSFTEVLVVIVVLAVLAAVALPKFTGSSPRNQDSALENDLHLVRNAVQLFKIDTGLYPKALCDLSATSAAGLKGIDESGTRIAVTTANWHGPYIKTVPDDPVSKAAFTYSNTTGTVKSSATNNDSGGSAYSEY